MLYLVTPSCYMQKHTKTLAFLGIQHYFTQLSTIYSLRTDDNNLFFPISQMFKSFKSLKNKNSKHEEIFKC